MKPVPEARVVKGSKISIGLLAPAKVWLKSPARSRAVGTVVVRELKAALAQALVRAHEEGPVALNGSAESAAVLAALETRQGDSAQVVIERVGVELEFRRNS